jgi:thiamine pyrophosphate-dependent acetolactate synthase large subunit-like protein
MTPTVSSAVADAVAEHADHLYGLMGNGNAFFVSALTGRGFPYTSARHEVSTVTMADAHFRTSGRIAAAAVTYSPGFTNAYTGLLEAARARVPLVLVTGDAPAAGRRPSDLDQSLAAEAIGVQTLTALPDNAHAVAERAFEIALATSQPVVLAIPYDLAEAPLVDQVPLPPYAPPACPQASEEQVAAVVRRLRAAHRPLILAGRGVVLAAAAAPLRAVGDRLGAMFATTSMAFNVIDSPWNLGVAGGFTRPHRLALMQQADAVLVVGAGLDPFQTRFGTLFAAGTPVIRVDTVDSANPMVTEHIHADAYAFLTALAARLPEGDPTDSWRARESRVATGGFHGNEPTEDPEEFGSDGRLNPRAVVAALDEILPRQRSVVLDGGNFFGWPPMYLTIPDPHALITVGTAIASIGLGFGSAAGVSVARPDRTTVFFTGDGGALMGLADLDTFLRVTRRGVIVVLNDSAYGAELHQYKPRGLDDTAMLIDEVDFAAVARGFGAAAARAYKLTDLAQLRDWLDRDGDGVFLLDVVTSQQIPVDFIANDILPGR